MNRNFGLFQNLRAAPRPYQIAALESWQRYYENHDLARTCQALFHMATGAGKTYVMAALMLDLYRRGKRNFVFFVNSTNILEKTRDNFLNPGSPKYLFQPNITIDGAWVRMREVTNFADSDPTAINILFTTTQRLHADLHQPHENRLTFVDFLRHDIVLLSDEAHHNNAQALRDQTMQRTWEETIADILKLNPHTILLEFTATIDLEDQRIAAKYQDHFLFQYDLRQFCTDKYSKVVCLYMDNTDLTQRMLQAVVISEFRQLVAEKHRITLKPIIMFKSRTILENQANLRQFIALIAALKPAAISALQPSARGILRQAFEFFAREKLSLADLCRRIQIAFAPDKLLRVDGGRQISTSLQRQINTLELSDNPYRAIFAVDMLKEGWDVLNLFDIVRLYETQDAQFLQTGRPGKTTISEAQLIGRGARYCPLKINGQVHYRRQFDQQPANELRILEQLHYYSVQDVQYIAELQAAFEQAGIVYNI